MIYTDKLNKVLITPIDSNIEGCNLPPNGIAKASKGKGTTIDVYAGDDGRLSLYFVHTGRAYALPLDLMREPDDEYMVHLSPDRIYLYIIPVANVDRVTAKKMKKVEFRLGELDADDALTILIKPVMGFE